ncbi:MAG: hypothetical protein COA86_00085 [Kangiella sp.]|nr:MAG: hypothetical protein COA86_00085 [Kangiella sp.]
MIHNKPIKIAVYSVSLLAVLWLVMAFDSGLFIAHDNRYAVKPFEFTDDGFSQQKKIIDLPSSTVAYLDIGEGPILVLLHGCPFSVFEWKEIIPELSKHYRIIAPDLHGLGDTPVRLDQDYRLPTDAQMVKELLHKLDIASASFIAHDHGGATLQLLMKEDSHLIDKAIMSNVEAYDQWPSKPELPYLKAIVNPFTSPLMYEAMQFDFLARKVFSLAVEDINTLTPEITKGFALPHIATAERWQRLRRFFAWQLDAEHNAVTMTAVDAMREFEKPMLLIWGELDENFGPDLAYRLASDIPGVKGISFMKNSQHMPMLEEDEAYVAATLDFLLHDKVSEEAVKELEVARNSGKL